MYVHIRIHILGESAFDVCQRVVSLFGSIRQARCNSAEEGAEAQVDTDIQILCIQICIYLYI
jgi:hypothetical protein